MEKFKIDLFRKEHNIDFVFHQLPNGECNTLIKKLIKKYDVTDRKNIVSEISIKQLFWNENNAESDGFNISDVLNKLSIKPQSEIYINWYNYDNIHVMDIVYFSKYFHDIWFPSSDDIDIFDSSLNWIVSIRHDGTISYVLTPQLMAHQPQ